MHNTRAKTIYKWTSVGRLHKLMNPMDMVEAYMLRRAHGKKKEFWCPCTQVCIVFFLFIVLLFSHHRKFYDFFTQKT
jgi:hypothetical protein